MRVAGVPDEGPTRGISSAASQPKGCKTFSGHHSLIHRILRGRAVGYGISVDQMPGTLGAYVDESSCNRSDSTQEYLIGAAIMDAADEVAIREELRPLLLPGQIKLHWTDERESRRRRIVSAIASLEPMNFIVAHLSQRQAKTERFRRKCLETLYYELAGHEVYSVTLESRGAQDKSDRAHIVALQGQGLNKGVRIQHLRGGDEPLLWIADAVLGSLNSAYLGEPAHFEALQDTIMVQQHTPDSLVHLEEGKRKALDPVVRLGF